MVKLRRAAAPDLPDVSSEDEDTCSSDGEDGSWCSTGQDGLSDIEELSEGAEQDAENQDAEQHAEQGGEKQPSHSSKVQGEDAGAGSLAAPDALAASLCGWFCDGTVAETSNLGNDEEETASNSSRSAPDLLRAATGDVSSSPSATHAAAVALAAASTGIETAAAATAAPEQPQDRAAELGTSFNPFAALDGVWSDDDSLDTEYEDEDEHAAQEQQAEGEACNQQPQHAGSVLQDSSSHTDDVSAAYAAALTSMSTSQLVAVVTALSAGHITSSQPAPAPTADPQQQLHQHQQRPLPSMQAMCTTATQQQPAQARVLAAPAGLAGSQLGPQPSAPDAATVLHMSAQQQQQQQQQQRQQQHVAPAVGPPSHALSTLQLAAQQQQTRPASSYGQWQDDRNSEQHLYEQVASNDSLPSLTETDYEDAEWECAVDALEEPPATQGTAAVARSASMDSLPSLAGSSDSDVMPDLHDDDDYGHSGSEPNSPHAAHGRAAGSAAATTLQRAVSTGGIMPPDLLDIAQSDSDGEPPRLLEQSESEESDEDEEEHRWQPAFARAAQPASRAAQLHSRPAQPYSRAAQPSPGAGMQFGTVPADLGMDHGAAPADGFVDVQRRQAAVHQWAQQAAPTQPMLQLRNGMGLGLRSAAAFLPAPAEQAVEEAVEAEAEPFTEGHECWICFNSGPGLFSPCATCSGGLRHIHRACFSKWLSTSWAMACPNCARPYAPQVLSQFEDGRLLLSLLEQQREQARASSGANGSSANGDAGTVQLDAPYPAYSVAHFTVGGFFQVCIPAEHQTPAGLLRTIRSVVESLAADPPYLPDGSRMRHIGTQLGGLVIEQRQPPAYGPHGHGHSWFNEDEELLSDDEYEESDEEEDEGHSHVTEQQQRLDGLHLRAAANGTRPNLLNGMHFPMADNGWGLEHRYVANDYHNMYQAGHGQREEQQQQQGNGGGGARRGARGGAVRELRRSVALQRRHDRQVNVGRRQANMGRAMSRGQRNR